jgi:hypothetical protein
MDDVQEDKEPNPEDPTEAISIIFDTSGSMKKNFVEQGINRMGASIAFL